MEKNIKVAWFKDCSDYLTQTSLMNVSVSVIEDVIEAIMQVPKECEILSSCVIIEDVKTKKGDYNLFIEYDYKIDSDIIAVIRFTFFKAD